MTLTVSNGPGNVSIPSVQGLSVAQATRELRHAGLQGRSQRSAELDQLRQRAGDRHQPAGRAIGVAGDRR